MYIFGIELNRFLLLGVATVFKLPVYDISDWKNL